MNTTNVLNSDSLRVARRIEASLYGALATVLISHLFFLSEPFTLQDAAIVLAGVVLGHAGCYAASPLTAAVGRWLGQGSSALIEEIFTDTADILPFVRRENTAPLSTANDSSADETRRAA